MSACKKISIPKPKICSSDLNKRIIIYQRPIEAPLYGSTNVNYGFMVLASVWAAMQTLQGDFLSDMVARSQQPTDRIYIRYREDITTDNWIGFDGYRFDILHVEDINRYRNYLSILCINTGNEIKEASKV